MTRWHHFVKDDSEISWTTSQGTAGEQRMAAHPAYYLVPIIVPITDYQAAMTAPLYFVAMKSFTACEW
jgi:hypothetical protein